MVTNQFIEICADCGEQHTRCAGHKKRKNSEDGLLHPCNRYPMKGRTDRKCYMCGGATPSGVASANFKHGKYSKALPPKLREKYELALNDEELTTLGREIALIDAQLQERLEKVYSGETREWWSVVRSLFRDLETALNLPDSDDTREAQIIHAVECLGASIESGATHFNAYETIDRMLEQRRKLVETENKRLEKLDQTITSTQAMTIISLLVDTVNRCVRDEEDKKRLAQEIYLIANQ